MSEKDLAEFQVDFLCRRHSCECAPLDLLLGGKDLQEFVKLHQGSMTWQHTVELGNSTTYVLVGLGVATGLFRYLLPGLTLLPYGLVTAVVLFLTLAVRRRHTHVTEALQARIVKVVRVAALRTGSRRDDEAPHGGAYNRSGQWLPVIVTGAAFDYACDLCHEPIPPRSLYAACDLSVPDTETGGRWCLPCFVARVTNRAVLVPDAG
jgi:hypothetical protein